MDDPTEKRNRKSAGLFNQFGYGILKEAIDSGELKKNFGSNTEDYQREKTLQSIDAALLRINEIKQYSNLSKNIKLKEKSIKENIVSNLLPVDSPASREFAQLALEMKKFYGENGSRQENNSKVKDLALIEFKLKYHIASRRDIWKVIDLATGTLRDIAKETNRAVTDNSKIEKVDSLIVYEKTINTGLDKISDKVKYARVEIMQRDLLSSLVNFEKKLDQSENESRLKSKGLIREPKPPVNNDNIVEKMVAFVKNVQTVEYQKLTEKKEPGANQDKVKEQRYRNNTVTILERTQSSLLRDKKINNYEGRNRQREALIEQVLRFSKGIKRDMEQTMSNKSSSQSIGKDYRDLNEMVKEVERGLNKKAFKNRVMEMITDNAKKLKFDKTKKTKKKKM